jgi:hypothetical protein
MVLVLFLLLGPASASAQAPANGAFLLLWQRTDFPVARGDVTRTWIWGDGALTPPLSEAYAGAPGGVRLVQYFDKSRMEITDPHADATSPWYVSNGLLTRELVTGRLQIGDTLFSETGQPAWIPLAGDPDNAFPTYADLQSWIDRLAPDQTGRPIVTARDETSVTAYEGASADPAADAAHFVSYTGPSGQPVGYNIPRAFWDFMTQGGLIYDPATSSIRQSQPLFDWLFVLGYPIGEAFWVNVRVAGKATWVLVQPFERRVLTYTPANPPNWRVEMGNIGQHYYRWRYELLHTTPDPTSIVVGDFFFNPNTLTVTRGTTVVWQVEGDRVHTVTSDNGSFDSGDISRGQIFSRRFERPGTFTFHDRYYSWMKGTIVVQ